jgi:tetratricopeptide (TPR) repeat protein
LVPHLRALYALEVPLPAAAAADLARAASRVSMAMLWGGSYLTALEAAESGITRSHGLSPEDPHMLTLRYQRGAAARFLGRYADAEAEYRQVLDARQRVLGPEHPSTLATRHEIARMMADQGRAADAEAEYRQVLDVKQRVLGPEHPSTLATRYQIAAALADQGRAADAEAEHRQVLDAEQRVLGPEHPPREEESRRAKASGVVTSWDYAPFSSCHELSRT